jgi:hypothetical protein
MEMFDSQSIITSNEPLKKEDEMQNDFSADIKMKVRGNTPNARRDFSMDRVSDF